MKNLSYYIYSIFLIASCVNLHPDKNNNQHEPICHEKKIENELLLLSDNFTPTKLNLNESLEADSSLTRFLDKMNVYCLEETKNYEYFISLLLLKQYKFHLSNFHQSYDLLAMENKYSSMLISGFIKMAKLDRNNLEMLSSSYIVEYVKTKPYLESQKNIEDQLNDIMRQESNLIQNVLEE